MRRGTWGRNTSTKVSFFSFVWKSQKGTYKYGDISRLIVIKKHWWLTSNEKESLDEADLLGHNSWVFRQYIRVCIQTHIYINNVQYIFYT